MTGDWRDDAACRGRSPGIWHHAPSVTYAKAICGRCPVRDDCLAHALAAQEQQGVWGGLTAAERLGSRVAVETRARMFVLVEIENGASTVRDLMRRLGMSLLQCRVAVRHLEAEGLVSVTRRCGAPLRFTRTTRERPPDTDRLTAI